MIGKEKEKRLLSVIDLFKHVNHGLEVAIEGGVEKWKLLAHTHVASSREFLDSNGTNDTLCIFTM